MSGGAAIFFDGLMARRHAALVRLDSDGLSVMDGAGNLLARWLYADLRQQDAPAECLRLSAAGAPELARLETADAALAAEILRRAPQIHRAARASRRTKAGIVLWLLAAAASVIFTAAYLVPQLADRLTPLVPLGVERRIGDAADNQVRAIFGDQACHTPEGDAALETLRVRLGGDAALPMPVEIAVLQSRIPNAFALPGGRIYLLSALLDQAREVNELAGVLAHEMGHVAHRDGMRLLLQSSASSFLIGLLFGDVLGGGTLVMIGRTLVDSAYSREAETAADVFAAERMVAQGQSPLALAEFLAQLERTLGGGHARQPGQGDDQSDTRTRENRGMTIFLSHPLTEDRRIALSGKDPATPGAPLLDEAGWRALKAICGEAGQPNTPREPDARPGP